MGQMRWARAPPAALLLIRHASADMGAPKMRRRKPPPLGPTVVPRPRSPPQEALAACAGLWLPVWPRVCAPRRRKSVAARGYDSGEDREEESTRIHNQINNHRHLYVFRYTPRFKHPLRSIPIREAKGAAMAQVHITTALCPSSNQRSSWVRLMMLPLSSILQVGATRNHRHRNFSAGQAFACDTLARQALHPLERWRGFPHPRRTPTTLRLRTSPA